MDNIEELLKGLFKVLETDISNASKACLCLVNISAKENGLNKIMSFINSDVSSNNLVYFTLKSNIFIIVNLNVLLENSANSNTVC